MKYPEKKAGTRKYHVRPDPVTHAIHLHSLQARGRRRAVCFLRVGQPRHDDGFTLDASKVDCERCKQLLQEVERKDITGCDV